MVYRVILALRARRIRYIVAPYESDAQIGYLIRNGHADVAITEDSDLLLYGASTFLFKLSKDGSGIELRTSSIRSCSEYNFQNWTDEMFRHMCILSGCDYLPSIKGLGLRKAYKVVGSSKRGGAAIRALRLSVFDVRFIVL